MMRGTRRKKAGGQYRIALPDIHNNRNSDIEVTNRRFLDAITSKKSTIADISRMLKSGANVDAHAVSGDTALMQAADTGNVSFVSILLEKGADSNLRNRHGHNALMKAACKGRAKVVSMLVTSTDLFAKDTAGKTALDWARLSNQHETTALLEEAMLAEINKRRELKFGSEKLREMAAVGIQLAEDNRKMQPIVRQALNEAISMREGGTEYTATKHVIEVVQQESTGIHREAWEEAIKNLQLPSEKETFYLDIEVDTTWTALTYAVANGDAAAVTQLISMGAGLDYETKRGHTALIWATICGHVEIARLLLFNGAQIDYQTRLEGRTALHHAAYNGQGAVCELLLDKLHDRALDIRQVALDAYRTNPNSRDRKAAAERDWLPYFQERICLKNKRGRTPLDEAQSQQADITIDLMTCAENRAHHRQALLDREAAKAVRVECALGCRHMDRADRILQHQVHECPKRSIGCPECGQFHPEEAMSDHAKLECPKRIVPCPNAYRGCAIMLPDEQMSSHLLHKCKKRVVVCRLGCNQQMSFDQRDDHEAKNCSKRRIICSWNCGAEITPETKRVHQKSECAHRIVTCRIGCGLQMQAKERAHHEEMICRTYCRHGCGERIGPSDRRELHERFVCPKRMLTCKLTHIPDIRAEDMDEWLTQYCPKREIQIALEPQTTVICEDYDTFVDPERGSCDQRLVRCRRDYVSKRLHIYSRALKKWEPGLVVELDSVQEQYTIRYNDGKVLAHCLRDLDFEEAEDDPSCWACGWVVAADLQAHAQVCPLEPVVCSDGQRIPRQHVAQHEAELARWRNEQQDQEKLQYVTCNDGVKVRKNDLERYLREDCGWTEVRCSLGCGRTMRRMEVEEHENQHCPKRIVACSLGCGIKDLWADEQEVHEQEHCLRRDVLCPAGCNEVVKSGELHHHMDEQCVHRLVECECGMAIPFSKYRDHRIMECPEERVQCRLGCGEKVRRADLEYFERYQSKRRPVPCKLGCGSQVFFDEQELHCNSLCLKRPVQCVPHHTTGCGGCGEIMRAEERADHDQTCPFRLITIYNSSRQLRSWSDGWRLIVCDQTGETVLTWAADHNEPKLAAYIIESTHEIHLDHETFSGETALTKACKRGHWEMVWLLLKRGADINQETKRGRTPLSEAACTDQDEVVKLLLREKVDFRHVDKRNRSAVQWARMSKSKKVLGLLEAALLVEKERHELCVAIACHDFDEVKRLVDDGEEYRLNHTAVLEQEAKQVDDMLAGLKNDAESLKQILEPLTPKVMKLQADLKMKEDAAQARIEEADRIAEYCDQRTDAQHMALKTAMLAIEHVTQGDIIDVLELKHPPREIERVLQCVCIVRGRAPKPVRNLKVNNGLTMSWWVSSLEMLQEKDLLHQLRFINKNNIPKAHMVQVRELMEENFGGFEYSAGEDGYPLVEALCMWIVALELYERVEAEKNPLLEEEGRQRVMYNTEITSLWQQQKHVKTMTARLSDLQSQVEESVREYERNLHMIDKYKEKLRVARLLEARDDTGQTVMSWACAVGNAEIVSQLLCHGAPMEYDAAHLNMAATAIQYTYRHFHWLSTRKPWSTSLSKRYRSQEMRHMLQMQDLLKKLSRKRKLLRVPLLEAAYNGNLGIMEELLTAKNADGDFIGARPTRRAWMRPAGRIPHPVIVQDLQHPLNVLECAELGQNECGSDTWSHGLGWTPDDKHNQAVTRARELWKEAEEFVAHWRQVKEDKLRIRERARFEKMMNERMVTAINSWDFEKCMKLVDEGAFIDHETQHCHTALTMAAMQATYSVNSDGDRVLSVCLLLNRDIKRPNIDHETKMGQTALTCAAHTDNVSVVEALLDLEADMNYVCRKTGKTALISAASNGKWQATRLLLERGAEIHHRDHSGRTAIDWAREFNFLGVMQMLSSAQAKFLGTAKANRGTAVELVLCSWGCGFMGVRGNLEQHEGTDCPKRVVICALGCDIEGMWAEEQAAHEAVDCPKRIVPCRFECGARVRWEDEQFHVDHECRKRKILCRNEGCAVCCEAFAMQRHEEKECVHRLVRCEECGSEVQFNQQRLHRREQCPMRRVRCLFHCGAEMWAKMRDQHMKETCGYRTVKCTWGCQTKVMAKDLIKHEGSSCKFRPVQCRNKCDAFVPFHKQREHERNACVKRFVPCSLNCGMKIRACDLDEHKRTQCDKRMVECELGCGDQVRADSYQDHKEHYCVKRINPCGLGCGVFLAHDKADWHKEHECECRLIYCALGCGKQLPKNELEQHETWKCRKRIILCGYGCNAQFVAETRGRHYKQSCPMRFMECPLGCGAQMRANEQQYHVNNQCPRRNASTVNVL